MTWQRLTAALVIASLVGAYFHYSGTETFEELTDESQFLGSSNVTIRQEVNILNRSLIPTLNASTSERIYLDSSKYSGTVTYYLEVQATSTRNADITASLRGPGGSICSLTIAQTIGLTPTLIRSSACTAPTAGTYALFVNNAGIVGEISIQAARVVILQTFSDTTVNATSTQTQIEIGSYINASSSTLSSPAADPKYWKYTASAWDGSPTFTVQATFSNTFSATPSTTLYTTAGSYTYVVSTGTAYTVVDAWGAGGAGFDGNNTGGGAGGGGGAFASSTLYYTVGQSLPFTIGAGGSGSGGNGANTTFNTTDVGADAGEGGTSNTTGEGVAGSTANSTGQVEFAGGLGGSGNGGDDGGGGGGGAAGPLGAGSAGNDASATAGGNGGDGNGGTVTGAGLGGNGGACSPGTSNAGGGEGGGGGDQASVGCNGGTPGAGGGGGEAGPGNGADGQLRITEIKGVVNAILQEDDGSFANWTNKVPVIIDGFSTSTGKLASSTTFTPVDGRNYRLVASTTAGTYSIFNAKIVINQGLMTGVTDDENHDLNTGDSFSMCSDCGARKVSQSFQSNGGTLTSAKFYLQKSASPTGNVTAELYAITGSHGGTAVPTGAALAVSDAIDASTLTTSFVLTEFTFSGANQYAMSDGTVYAIVVSYNTSGTPNFVQVQRDSASPTHAGNPAFYGGASWTTSSLDIGFVVIVTAGGVVSKLEPQYLLANTTVDAGTGLQNSLTKWDSSEFTSSSYANFYHQLDAADNSASVGTINEAGGTLVASSTVTSPDNVGQSLCMTMPSNGNLDMKLTTNNGDVYASRIIATVDLNGGMTCSGGGEPPPATATYIEEIYFFQ